MPAAWKQFAGPGSSRSFQMGLPLTSCSQPACVSGHGNRKGFSAPVPLCDTSVAPTSCIARRTPTPQERSCRICKCVVGQNEAGLKPVSLKRKYTVVDGADELDRTVYRFYKSISAEVFVSRKWQIVVDVHSVHIEEVRCPVAHQDPPLDDNLATVWQAVNATHGLKTT
jgi:hypothetical protein